VEIRVCVFARDVALPSRTAALATPPASMIAAKIRIFFISVEILAKFGISGQAKYDDLLRRLC